LLLLAISCWERNPFPWRAWLTIVVCIVAIRLFRVDYEFVRWFEGIPGQTKYPLSLQSSGITILFGAIAGCVLGVLSQYFLPFRVPSYFRSEELAESYPKETGSRWVQGSLLVGCVMGWQSVALIIPLSLYGAWLWKWFLGPKSTFASMSSMTVLFVVAFVYLMAWRQIVSMIGITS
jgi:hypothetical protein